MFLEKCLNMLMYLVSLLRSCCFSSCTVGGFFPMKRSELKKKLPSLLFVCRWIVLYKHKPNKLSSRNRPSKYCNKCCPHSLMGTSPRSMSYISPTPPGNNHGYELTKICFVWSYSLSIGLDVANQYLNILQTWYYTTHLIGLS